MSDIIEVNPNANKNLTLAIYILYAITPFVGGVTGLIAIIINYVKRDDVKGTWLESHFNWQIKTFWWTLIGSVIGFLTIPIVIGVPILVATFIWWLYRLVKGCLYWNDNKPLIA